MKGILFILFLLILSLFYLINKTIDRKEHYCKIPESNQSGTLNDKKVLLTDYSPQSNILTSSCDQYWKDWPFEKNNTMVENNPIVIKSDQLSLPKERDFGSNSYQEGLIDFNQLAQFVSDKVDDNILERSYKLLINPISKEKFDYDYQLEYFYIEQNKKTYINRWQEYNPSVKTFFDYDEIKSPMENINILNMNFRERCNTKQKKLLDNKELILFGLINFEIFKYKILYIQYLNNDPNIPVYIIEIALFRESDLYLNTFSYIGYIENNNVKILNVKYIGRNSTDNVLLPDFYNPNELKEQIINKNFDNSPLIEKDPDVIVALTKKEKEDFKLKNQYACFNVNYSPSRNNEYILRDYSRESCEVDYDRYNRPKEVGIYDTPCKNNEECPFYKRNENYDNDFGKCLDTGYCELPVNMQRIGFKYFTQNKNELPLCYNCDTTKFELGSDLDTCCLYQYDKKKYPHLKSPDYAFKDDIVMRQNYFNKKFCTQKQNSEIICKDIIIS